MKFSNRIMGFLLLLSIIGAFYIFYQVFFKIKLTNLEISSNVGSFSGSLENIKFSKNFYCKEKKCLISEIPPFKYKLKISKNNYKNIIKDINLKDQNLVNIFLEKEIIFNKIEEKKLTKREEILKLSKSKIKFGNKRVYYNKILGDSEYVYFTEKNKNKLYFYNLNNNNSFSIDFKPKINYIKKLTENKLLLNTDVGSFIFNILNKKLEYFSLFSDFVIVGDNYIGVINNDDENRKKNFDLGNTNGNILMNYNIKTKKKYILKNLENKISKIYLENKNLFIIDDKGNKFEVKGY